MDGWRMWSPCNIKKIYIKLNFRHFYHTFILLLTELMLNVVSIGSLLATSCFIELKNLKKQKTGINKFNLKTVLTTRGSSITQLFVVLQEI